MPRAIAFFQPGWADWEAGPVLAMLRELGDFEVSVATPDGGPQVSIGGVRASADTAFDKVAATDAEVFLVIGSDAWPKFHDEAFFALLRQAAAAETVIGAIRAGTVAAARAGLFASAAHTSNGRDWLARTAPDYSGAEHYVETPKAVAAGRLVSAAGSAPSSFCAEILKLAVSEKAAAMSNEEFAAEWRT